MPKKIRIGVQLQPQHADYDAVRRAVIRAEALGVDAIYNWDHFYPLSGDPDGKHFECWTMLGSWAEITERAEIGALVTCNSYRNPELLADMARTVNHASNGRLILGIGAGWFDKDYEQYGYKFGTAGYRLADLREALPRIKSPFDELNPAPTRPIPIMIGGGGEKKTLRYTAEFADIWHGFGNAETIKHKNAILDDWCRQIDQDPAEIERSCGANPKRIETADELHAASARFFTLGFDGTTGFDMAMVSEWIAWRNSKNAA